MKGRVILFVSEAIDASPTRYRAIAFFDRLRARGWEPRHATVVGLWRRVALLHAARDADVIVVLRKLFTPAFCRVLKGRHRRLILDIDDAVFASESGDDAPERLRRFARTAGAVDAVWAGNAHLAAAARRSCPTAVVLPTSIVPEAYVPRRASVTSPTYDLVWIGSSPTRKYLESAVPAIARFAASGVGDVRLKIIADFDLPPESSHGLRTVAVAWSAATEAAELAASHVGLAPMPDDPWTRGKCGLKVLQYMAAGLPVVAADCGVHRDLIVHGETGFLVADEAAWLAALERLRADATLRERMGRAGRARAERLYSVAATFDAMSAALDVLAPRE